MMKWLRYFTFLLFLFILSFFFSPISVNAQSITPTVTLKNYNNTSVLLSGYTNYNPNSNEFYVGKVEFPFGDFTLISNTIYSFSMTYDFFVDEFGDNGNFGYGSPEFYLLSSNGLTLQSATLQNFSNVPLSGSCINSICTYRMNITATFTASKNGTIYLAIPLDVPYIVHGFQFVSADVTSYGQNQNNSDIIANNNQNTQNIINNNNQNTQNIINSQNETTDAIEDLQDTLTDDDLSQDFPSGGGGGTYFDSIGVGSEAPISNIILMPLKLIRALWFDMDTSCSTVTIPFDFFGGNHQLTFNCWTISDYLGSNLTSLIDGMFALFMIYEICMLGVSFFESITSLEDVFDSLYAPRHALQGYKPKH